MTRDIENQSALKYFRILSSLITLGYVFRYRPPSWQRAAMLRDLPGEEPEVHGREDRRIIHESPRQGSCGDAELPPKDVLVIVVILLGEIRLELEADAIQFAQVKCLEEEVSRYR